MREGFLLFVPSESPALRNVLGGVEHEVEEEEEEHVGREDLCWMSLVYCTMHFVIGLHSTAPASLTGGTH